MQPIRVAIADDHAIVREGLTRLLESYPEIEVVGTAKDSLTAVELARTQAPDVFLVDIVMPDLDGISAIPRLTQASPTTRILVLSMYDEPEYAQAAIRHGAYGLVSKAASTQTLVAAIHTAFRSEPIPSGQTLSSRESQILALIAIGKTNAQIAARLSIRPKTVDHHCERLMEKLDIHTRPGLVAYAKRIGICPAD
jgi:DNA-binding NarL/FixJ family response regulator